MIYLDNAATTWPKPPQVYEAVNRAMRVYGANPGRSGHAMSTAAAEEMYRCREAAAQLFHAPGPECVAFTLNCTEAVNMVLKGRLKPGDHVVVSCLEHNAVMRPLQKLSEERGVTFTQAQVVPGDNDATVDAFRKAFRANTALVFCTHASNVWGIRLPVERIAALAKEYGIPMAVDCAQSAGVLPINMQDSGISWLCIAGHKGLYGPMGTGMLIASSTSGLDTLIEGGTGTESRLMRQPDSWPERMESGTPNLPGIAGLRAGIEFVKKKGTERIYQHELKLTASLYDRLSQMPGVILYTERPQAPYYAPVLSFNIRGIPSEEAGRLLDQKGFAVRPGLHCAPAAHTFAGTSDLGAVRVCPSAFTTPNEIASFAHAVANISSKS